MKVRIALVAMALFFSPAAVSQDLDAHGKTLAYVIVESWDGYVVAGSTGEPIRMYLEHETKFASRVDCYRSLNQRQEPLWGETISLPAAYLSPFCRAIIVNTPTEIPTEAQVVPPIPQKPILLN